MAVPAHKDAMQASQAFTYLRYDQLHTKNADLWIHKVSVYKTVNLLDQFD